MNSDSNIDGQAGDAELDVANTTINAPAPRVTKSGLIAQGDVRLTGQNVAGRDVNVHYHQQAAIPTVPFQLPPDIGDFTGRETITAAVESLLKQTDDEHRTSVVISAIAGKAGIGKTSLALHVAHRLRSSFPDGQLFVNLRGAETQQLDPAEVLSWFLRALGMEGPAIPNGLDERARLYRSRLTDKRILVVLDNAANEAQVRPLLPGTATCKALITSRARLSALEAARSIQLEVLALDQALDLLTTIIGRDRIDAELDNARSIVQLCGGLPLAVRVAGARLAAKPHWRLAVLVERLRDERRCLSELKIGDLEVRASLRLSYVGRNDQERQSFRLLSLLTSLDFPAWVAGALLDADYAAAEDAVEGLVDAQLLEVATPEDTAGQTRFRFHDLLRTFARECLDEEETPTYQHDALERILTTALHLATEGDLLLRPGQLVGSSHVGRRWSMEPPSLIDIVRRDPLAWFEAERVTLVSAVRQAYDAELWELAYELASVLEMFFDLRALWDDWQITQELALEAVRHAGNRSGEARILRNIGRLDRYRGRFGEAMVHFQDSLRVYRELGDRNGQACAIRSIAVLNRYQSRWAQAEAGYDQCLAIFRELGNRYDEALTLSNLGTLYLHQSRWDHAKSVFEDCLSIFRNLGDRRWEATTIRDLAEVYREEGLFGKALDSVEESLAIFRSLRDTTGEATTLVIRGELLWRQQRFDEAVACLETARSLFSELGNRAKEVWAMRYLSDAYRDSGQLEEAARWLEKALPFFHESGDRWMEATAFYSLGQIQEKRGLHDEAVASYDQSLPALHELGESRREAKVLHSRGRALAAKGDDATARASWEQALEIYQALGVPERWELESLLRSGLGQSGPARR
jgi:tetratricopeptide (TPR) repeat protein